MFYQFIMVLFLLTLLLFSDEAYSEIYKWLDENGKVVYGDKPVSKNADEIKIKNTLHPDPASQERYKNQKKLLKILQEERNEKLSLKKEAQETKAKQEKECAELSAKLQKMKEYRALYEETDDPFNPKIISDEERKLEENKYEKYIKEHC